MTEAEQRESALNAAPSEIKPQEPTLLRLFAILGLGFASLGAIAVVMNQYGPRLIGTTGGLIFAFVGLAILLMHAFRDGDLEFRRIYLGLGYAALIGSLILAILPGTDDPKGVSEKGYYFIPYAPCAALAGLLFIVASIRHENSDKISRFVNFTLLASAIVLTVSPVIVGILRPHFLAGPGLLLAIVGVCFACAYLNRAKETAQFVGISLGILGGVAFAYAMGRSFLPDILHTGPKALKTATQNYDPVLLAARVGMIAVLLAGVYFITKRKSFSTLGKILSASVLAVFALALTVTIFAAPIQNQLSPYLVPGGLILGLIGLVYLTISMAYSSDSQTVALFTRELSAFFVSPIAYLVLIGAAFVSSFGYLMLTYELTSQNGRPALEPIIGNYWSASFGAAFLVIVIVPAITMRLFSEEKRTGTLEVLLTSPVSEWQIVLTKFSAAWLFYMVVWLPLGLFLLGLRSAGSPFEYRPLLSYYLAQAVTGAALVAMGLFFSAITKNQIVAAVMTFAGTFGLLLTIVLRNLRLSDSLSVLMTVASKLDFLTAWQSSLNGKLSIAFIGVYLSLAIVWLFLTVKVLESRRWA